MIGLVWPCLGWSWAPFGVTRSDEEWLPTQTNGQLYRSYSQDRLLRHPRINGEPTAPIQKRATPPWRGEDFHEVAASLCRRRQDLSPEEPEGLPGVVVARPAGGPTVYAARCRSGFQSGGQKGAS